MRRSTQARCWAAAFAACAAGCFVAALTTAGDASIGNLAAEAIIVACNGFNAAFQWTLARRWAALESQPPRR